MLPLPDQALGLVHPHTVVIIGDGAPGGKAKFLENIGAAVGDPLAKLRDGEPLPHPRLHTVDKGLGQTVAGGGGTQEQLPLPRPAHLLPQKHNKEHFKAVFDHLRTAEGRLVLKLHLLRQRIAHRDIEGGRRLRKNGKDIPPEFTRQRHSPPLKEAHSLRTAFKGNDKHRGPLAAACYVTVEFIRTMEDRLAGVEGHPTAVGLAKKLPLIHVHHLPEVVRLALRSEVLFEFQIMDGDDTGYDKQIVDLMPIVFQSFFTVHTVSIARAAKKFNKIYEKILCIFLLFYAMKLPCIGKGFAL